MGNRAFLYEKIKECLTERPLSKDLRRSGNRTSHVNMCGESVPGEATASAKGGNMFRVFKKRR